MRMLLASLGFVLLGIGCVPRAIVIPDPRVIHQVAKDGSLEVWIHKGGGKYVKQKVKIPAGYFVAHPMIVDPPEAQP